MNLDKLKNINDNPLTKRAERRRASFSEEQKKRIEVLNDMAWKDYKLKVIKRTKTIPRKGDVFLVSPQSNCYFWGVVIQEQVYHIEEESFWLVFILKDRVSEIPTEIPELDMEDLLVEPTMVGEFFWHSGEFFNVGKIEIPSELDYGFFRIGEGFVDEYGKPLEREPKIWGTYGLVTRDGLAWDIHYEMIANNIYLT